MFGNDFKQGFTVALKILFIHLLFIYLLFYLFIYLFEV
jgi:hypothetical protein